MKLGITIVMAGLISLCGYCWLLPDQKTQRSDQEPTAQDSPNSYHQQLFAKINQTNRRINALSVNQEAMASKDFIDQAGLSADIHQFLDKPKKRSEKSSHRQSPNKRSHK